MIREERDAGFWNAVATHPDVRDCVFMNHPTMDLAPLVEPPTSLPLAAEHGGFIFLNKDGLGLVYELHTMFTPAGWGREVAAAAREAFDLLFLRSAQLVFTLEVETNVRSRPPLSHGWRTAGPFTYAPDLAANVRTWVLTREAWDASPVRRRMCQSLQQSVPA
jgi:hypothetical protein